MKSLRHTTTLFAVLFLALLALVFVAAPGSVRASNDQVIVVDEFDAITTATLTVTSSGFESVDIATGLGLNSTRMARAVRDETITVEVFAQDDGSEDTSKCHVKFFDGASAPESDELDGSTVAKTGYVVEEGQRVRFTVVGRYPAISGLANTSKVSVVRIRSD